MINRRDVLKAGSLAAAGLAFAPRLLFREVFADESEPRPVLVHVLQRGGMDGLSAVVPYADKNYRQLRKGTLIRPPVNGRDDTAIKLDGRFGLHPALRPLAEDFKAGRLAIFHAVGSPDPTRSHFDAQDYMESGTPGVKGTDQGWLARYIRENARDADGTFRSIALSNALPRTMRGNPKALAISNFRTFTVGGGDLMGDAFEGMYAGGEGEMNRAGAEAFDAVARLRRLNPAQHKPENGAQYPRGRFGEQMLSIAQLIKSNVGLEVAFADSGGWDTHLNQGGATGGFANRLRDLGQALHAFSQDLGDRMKNVVLVTLTEFGRTAKENGTNGTDHGHGSVSFVLGGEIKGGKVLGKWPGLSQGNLYQRRDLAVTTDFRDILTEVLGNHLHAKGIEQVFPGHKTKKVGLLA
jgi:uncharacterized protein (DUF1501 family)